MDAPLRVSRHSVHFSHSVVSDSLWPHGLQHARLPCPSPTPEFMSIKSVMPSNHLILCCALLLPSVFPSIRIFSSESFLCIREPNYWSFSFSLSPSNVYSGLISFRMDWLDLLAVLGTLKSLLQHHSSKASILRCSAFFMVQLSHPYMTTGKTIALTRQTFCSRHYKTTTVHPCDNPDFSLSAGKAQGEWNGNSLTQPVQMWLSSVLSERFWRLTAP